MDIEQLAGTKLGNYEIESLLGRGGMGVVYKARQISLDRSVALKILPPGLSSDSSFVKRFKREARAVAKLSHSNIVQIFDIAQEDDLHFFSMDYIDGQTLDEVLKERGRLASDEAVRIITQAASGVEHAHEIGILHRDIKPSNMILDRRGNVKVMDFGLARMTGEGSKLTQSGTLMGTLDYMSPEQCRGEELDFRTDIYSLGVVLYEMLAGKAPFDAPNEAALIYKIIHETPELIQNVHSDISMALEKMVRKMMQKDPRARHNDMGVVLACFESVEIKRTSKITPVAVATGKSLPLIPDQSPFVGREHENAELRRMLARAKSGNGTLVMIGGEPGVGKTRLCKELIAETRQHGYLILSGQCYEATGAPSYIPFVEAVESAARIVGREAFREALGNSAPEVAKLVPELRKMFCDIGSPAELPPEQERRYIFNAVRDFMARAALIQPILLVLEDLQWADDPSLQLLRHMAQHLHEMPLLILGTYRDTELDVAVSLARCLEELVRQRLVDRLSLKRLPESIVGEMLEGFTGQEPPSPFVQAVYGETEGNPFFVEEIFRHLIEKGQLFDAEGRWRSDLRIDELDVPESVRLVVSHRLERVSEQCRQMLTAGAIVGRGFNFNLLRELLDLHEDALLDAIDAAERMQIIFSKTEHGEAGLIFAHDLIRQTLVSSLSLPRRQRLHMRVAEAMERLYADAIEERATAMAHHLSAAGTAADKVKAVYYLSLAGDRALKASAFEDALRLYNDALSLHPADDKRGRAELVEKLGFVLRSHGRQEEALTNWGEALELYEQLDDTEAVGSLCAEMAVSLAAAARLEEAQETVIRGISSLGNSVSVARCRLLAMAGTALSLKPDAVYSDADHLLSQALDIAEELGDERVLGFILLRKALFQRSFWQSAEGVETGVRATELLRRTGHLFDAAFALAFTQGALMRVGRFDEAVALGPEAKSLAIRVGNDLARFFTNFQDLLLELAISADLDRFEKGFTSSLELSLSTGFGWIAYDYLSLGRAQFLRGSWDKAHENFQKAAELEVPGIMTGFCIGPFFLFTAYAREREAAIALLQSMKDIQIHTDRPNTMGVWAMLVTLIEGLAVLGEWEKAAELYPSALNGISTGNVLRPFFEGILQTVAGISAMAGRQWEKAEKHYKTALRHAHEIPHKIEQPEVRRWYAHMLIERNGAGDKEKARALLTEAIEMYREIGMPKHLEIAGELLARI